MIIEDNKIIFDSNIERIHYNNIYNYIKTFYATDNNLKQVSNNIKYFKQEDNNLTYFDCFLKEVNSMLVCLKLEKNEYIDYYNDYINADDKENTLLYWICKKVYLNIVSRLKLETIKQPS